MKVRGLVISLSSGDRDIEQAIKDVARELADSGVEVQHESTEFRDDAEYLKQLYEDVIKFDFVVLDAPDGDDSVHQRRAALGLIVGRMDALGKEVVAVGEGGAWIRAIESPAVSFVSQEERGLLLLSRQTIRLAVYKALSRTTPTYKVRCYRDREAAKLDEAFRNAEDQVQILVTNLIWFTTEPRLSALTNFRGKLRILTLDPQSVFVAHRATQLGLQTEKFRKEMADSLQKMYLGIAKQPNAEIRTYNDFPTQITIAVDEDVYICTVARASRSRQGCIFKVNRRDPGVERSFVFHFDTLWTIASPYSPGHIP